MKNIRILSALASLLLLSSCALDAPEIPASELYLRGFIKKFGLIDPTQNWNQAVSAEVTLVTSGNVASGIVYAKSSGKYYKVAELYNVSGKVTIPIDIVANVNQIKMVLDGKTYYTEVGGTVDTSAGTSRATVTVADDEFVPLTPTNVGDQWLVMPGQQALAFFNTVPEGGPNVQRWNETKNEYEYVHEFPGNLTNPNIVTDFTLVSDEDKEIVIYPIYWNTSQDHELGIYYFKDSENASGNSSLTSTDIVRNRLFTMSRPPRTEDLITRYDLEVDDDGNNITRTHRFFNPYSDQWQDTEEGTRIINEVYNSDYYFPPISGDYQRTFFLYNNRNYVVEKADHYDMSNAHLFMDPNRTGSRTHSPYPIRSRDADAYPKDYTGNVISRGIAVKIPAGVHYGYYIHFKDVIWPYDEKYVYSEVKGNIDYMNNDTYSYKNWKIDYSTIDNKELKNTYCAIFDQEVGNTTFTYLTFEDWTPHSSSINSDGTWKFSSHPIEGAIGDYDLNDVAFVVKNVNLTTDLDKDESFEFLICAEDLGTTDDFDFNDMIVGVNTITVVNGSETKKHVTFKALAAGGTLPLYLHCIYPKDGTSVDETLCPEGQADKEWHRWFGIDDYTQMINTYNTKPYYKGASVTIVADASFSLSKYGRVDNTTEKGISGVYITVNSENPTSEYDVYNPGKTITAPQPGEAPQMFLIEDKGYNGKPWKWPAERAAIEKCYDKFLLWAGSSAWTGQGTPDDSWINSHYHYWYQEQGKDETYQNRH